jgi:hypothetical protein
MVLPILERLSAVRFEKDLISGSTRPCVFSCINEAGGHAGEYVVKFRSEVRGNELGLMFEVVAAQLAACLCIPMPNPALIRLPPDLADAMPEASVASRVRKSKGLNFGTRFLGGGYATWLVDDPIPNSLLPLAAAIVAFDALIDNADRRREKPNLLSKGEELYIIDHEVAFAFTLLVGWRSEPWERRNREFLKNHPLYAGLRGRGLDLTRFESALQQLDDVDIEAICGSVPIEFGGRHLDKIAEQIRFSRDQASGLVEAVRRVLK